MNRTFKVIWNASRQVWMVVGELTKAHGKSKSQASSKAVTTVGAALLATGLSLTAAPALADTWSGTTGDWANDANWADNSAPTSVNDAIIDNGGTAQVTTSGAQAVGLFVGSTSTGTLAISNGGTVNSGDGYIGINGGSTGTATVDGTGSSWTNGGTLYVGNSGAGTLTISNGGAVSNTDGYLGVNSTGTGAVTVDGAGSSWTNGGDLYVGDSGTGTLTISNGGAVSNTFGHLGVTSGGTGIATVDGAGSSWTNSTELYVGDTGSGTLTISNGGAVSSGNGYIGINGGSTGTATVDGTGSSWTNSGYFIVGDSGTGTLTISNGGAVSNDDGYLGFSSGGTGTVTVDGTGSSWTNGGDLYVGDSGTGTLAISNGGTVNVNAGAGIAYVARSSGSTGTLNIGAAFGDTAAAAGTLNAATVAFGSGTGTLVFNHTETAYDFAPVITGAGSVALYSGTTNLTGSSSYSGTTTVNGGTLKVNNLSGSATGSSSVTVNSGGTLGGSGTISGAVTVADGATIAAGNSPGTLTVGDLTLNNNSVLEFELDSPSGTAGVDSDLIAVNGNLTLDGILNITDLGGFDFGVNAGDSGSYRLFSYSGNLTDNTLAFGSGLLAGYNYTIDTATAGEVALTADYNGLQFWDGGDTNADSTVDGGNGTWGAASTNWTSQDGSANYDWSALTAVFNGTAGTVEIDGTHTVSGLQFGTDGYQLTDSNSSGGALALTSTGAEMRTDSNVTAMVDVALTGSGSLTKTGDGTLTLTGSNTYSGSTTISAGTLQIGDGGATGSMSGDITNNGTLAFNRSDDVTYSNVISGTGSLTQAGSGTLTLTGDNTYSGGTTISAGTLQIGDGGATGSMSGDITNNGTLAFNRSDDVTYSNVISGIGSLTQAGSGTLTLTGDNTYSGGTTISAGTLQIGNGGSTGSIIGDVTNDGSLIFNRSDAQTFAGAISGTGSVTVASGMTRFTGNLGGLTGTVTVDGGTLSIADGDTLTLGSDYIQTANGVFKTGASSSTSYGKLSVAGTATFATDTTIDVDVSEINTLAHRKILSSVISAGTLNASTFTLTDNSLLFDFTAVINGNSIDLEVFDPNAAAVVESVQSTGFNTGLGAAQVLDTIVSGDVEISSDMEEVVTALGQLATQQQVSDAVAETMPLLVSGTTQIAVNTLHSTNRVIQARQSSFSGVSSGDFVLADKHLWFKPVGSWTEQDERNGVAGYQADSYGFVGGIDSDLNESTKLGFAVSYMNSDIEGRDTSSGNKADIDAYQAIVYGSHSLQNQPDIEFNWQADLGINKTEGRRNISFINRTAKADYDSYTAHIGVGAGKRFALNDTTTIIPSIRADYAYIKDQSYTETGAGALNLNVDSNSSDELILMAQANVSHTINDKTTLIANAGVGYDLLNDTTSLTASYTGGGTAFTTQGIDPSPWLARAGVGMNFQTGDTSEITARYDLEGREDFLNQTASVKFRWLF